MMYWNIQFVSERIEENIRDRIIHLGESQKHISVTLLLLATKSKSRKSDDMTWPIIAVISTVLQLKWCWQ